MEVCVFYKVFRFDSKAFYFFDHAFDDFVPLLLYNCAVSGNLFQLGKIFAHLNSKSARFGSYSYLIIKSAHDLLNTTFQFTIYRGNLIL